MNIQGLFPMSNRTKVAHLRDLAAESNTPFISLTETHLSEDILSAEVQIPGYTLYRSDRQGGRTHGGCAIYCRDDLTVKERAKYSNNFCESQVIELKELDLILVNIYRPPNSPFQLFQDTLEKVQEAINEDSTKTLLATGDYNFPFISWPSKRIYSRDEEPEQMSSEKRQAKLLLNWAEENFLEQIIQTPTRGKNILDLVFTSTSELVSGYSTVVNRKFSDHNILRVNLNYKYKNEKKTERKNPYPNNIYKYDLMNATKEDWIRYDALLSKLSEDFEEKSEGENTEERLTRYYKILERVVETLFEKKEAFKCEEEKKNKPKNKIPKEVRILMRKKTSISKKILTSNNPKTTLRLMKSLQVIEEDLERRYKTMKLKMENEALGKIKRNPKYFYSYANKFSKIRTKVGPLIDNEGNTLKEPFEMAELLRKQYESTFSEPDPDINLDNLFREIEEDREEEQDMEDEEEDREEEDDREDDDGEKSGEEDNTPRRGQENEDRAPPVAPGPPTFTNVAFDYMDIVAAIEQLSLCSGPGPDGISAILLKKAKISNALMLENIFRHSLENSEIPDILRLGYICPILKPNASREKAASWRPVSLTSHVIKTFERVNRRQLVNYLESNNLMDQDQHGSRGGKSCLSQLLEHHDEIFKMLEKGENVDVIYTDF